MNLPNAQIESDAYARGALLGEAIFKFGSSDLLEICQTTFDKDIERKRPKEADGMLGALAFASEGFMDLQNMQRKHKEALENLKEEILDLIKDTELIAYGYQLPRNIADKGIAGLGLYGACRVSRLCRLPCDLGAGA